MSILNSEEPSSHLPIINLHKKRFQMIEINLDNATSQSAAFGLRKHGCQTLNMMKVTTMWTPVQL